MKKTKISDFIKNDRINRGMYQSEYAELLGISRTYYIMLEKGHYKNPGLKILKNISQLTGVSIKTLNDMCGGE